jgi:hypothetical protein
MVKNLLLLGVIALGATCVILTLQLQARGTKIDLLQKNLATAEMVNGQNVNEVKRLALEKGELVSKLAADVARSEAAMERITLLEHENETLERAFVEQQRALGEADPVVAEWQLAGMPASVACSLWPGSRTCPD